MNFLRLEICIVNILSKLRLCQITAQKVNFGFFLGKIIEVKFVFIIDPLGRPVLIMISIDCPYVGSTFQNPMKRMKCENNLSLPSATAGLAEWIIDDSCLHFCTNFAAITSGEKLKTTSVQQPSFYIQSNPKDHNYLGK